MNTMMNSPRNPFQLLHSVPGRTNPLVAAPLKVAENLLGLSELQEIYHRASNLQSGNHFFQDVLSSMNVELVVRDYELSRIPKKGAAIIIANHPFGGIEGVALGALLHSIRPDMKIMANYLLAKIPELADSFITVDPFGKDTSPQRNLKGLKETLMHLKSGGILAVFPAGEVSSFSFAHGEVTDNKWSDSIARIIRHTQCPVVPVFFSGHNRLRFQMAGLVHPLLRTALLPHEFVNSNNTKLQVTIGNILQPSKLVRNDDTAMIGFLRSSVYVLKEKQKKEKKIDTIPTNQPIDKGESMESMIKEIEQLPFKQKLFVSGDFFVFYVQEEQAPGIVREIGRLREITFRGAGEGTGKARDVDKYDKYYTHIFIWNAAQQEIAGAYRIGRTDVIVEKYGRKGLYIHSLFKIRKKFLRRISPSLELGRSFVRIEYQRSAVLLLLWKGIGQYLHLYPEYKVLFGAVSISNEYRPQSRKMMISFLEHHVYDDGLAKYVKPRNPERNMFDEQLAYRLGASCSSIEQVSSLVSELEPDGKGVPTLLKHYLKLGGKLLGFNRDEVFSNVVDGLILVDITKTNPHILKKITGKEEVSV
ncbi:MAG: lysophospholipid acyltransferase family protein [Ignavibacteriae bacterium]|nr:lysophospholipid acyltransferase family protein [Ignavibacteriota bacterium]